MRHPTSSAVRHPGRRPVVAGRQDAAVAHDHRTHFGSQTGRSLRDLPRDRHEVFDPSSARPTAAHLRVPRSRTEAGRRSECWPDIRRCRYCPWEAALLGFGFSLGANHAGTGLKVTMNSAIVAHATSPAPRIQRRIGIDRGRMSQAEKEQEHHPEQPSAPEGRAHEQRYAPPSAGKPR